MTYAIDFDGTLCENKWPDIGVPRRELIEFLKEEKRNGVKLILWTCRCGTHLTEAIKWCEKQGIIFDAINENLPEQIEKFGDDSRKICADLYFDDKACFI